MHQSVLQTLLQQCHLLFQCIFAANKNGLYHRIIQSISDVCVLTGYLATYVTPKVTGTVLQKNGELFEIILVTYHCWIWSNIQKLCCRARWSR